MSTFRAWAVGVAGRPLAVFTIAALAVAGLAPSPANAQGEQEAKVSFSETPVQLGEAQAEDTVTKTILAKNEGDEPITFTRVTTTCSCISGTVETRQIEPGDAAEVEVRLDALPTNGPLRKNLYVWIDGRRTPVVLPVAAQIVGGRDPGEAAARSRPTRPEPPATLSVEIEPSMADMGDLRPQQAREMTLELVNTGDEPIRFTRVQSDCSCASGEVSQDPVEPGESATLTVRMEAGPNVGPLNRTLNVWAAGQRRPVPVPVQARVTYAVHAEPFFLNMVGQDSVSGEVVLTSTDGRPFRVISAGCDTPVGGQGDDPNEAALEHKIRWDLSGVDPENLEHFWLVQTDHPESPLLAFRVIHLSIFQELAAEQNSRSWTLSQDHMTLGDVTPGGSIEREIEFIGLRADSLEAVRSRNGFFSVELVDKQLGARGLQATMKVTPAVSDPNAMECFGVLKDVLVFTDGEQETEMRIFGVLKPQG